MKSRRLLAMVAISAVTATIVSLTTVPADARLSHAHHKSLHHKKAAGYKLMDTSNPRWNPCSVITYRANVAKVAHRKKAVANLRRAVRRISRATGLRYRYVGRTKRIPTQSRTPSGPDLIVAWVRPGQSSFLPKGTAGVAGMGGFRSDPSRYAGHTPEIVNGYVLINRSIKFPYGFGVGNRTGVQGTVGQLLMHELGHSVGLSHVMDTKQIMYPSVLHRHARWGKGDLAGMRRVGATGGCIRHPWR